VTNPILLKIARMRRSRMSLVRNVKSTIVEAKYPARSSIVIMAPDSLQSAFSVRSVDNGRSLNLPRQEVSKRF
jgi:hypothetical protein